MLWNTHVLEESLTSRGAPPAFAANVATLPNRLANPSIGGQSKLLHVIIFLFEMCVSDFNITSVNPCICPAFSTRCFSRLWNIYFRKKLCLYWIHLIKRSPFCHQDLQGKDNVGRDDKEHQWKQKAVKEAEVTQEGPPAILLIWKSS